MFHLFFKWNADTSDDSHLRGKVAIVTGANSNMYVVLRSVCTCLLKTDV